MTKIARDSWSRELLLSLSRALAGAIEAKGISQRLIPRPTTKIARDSWSRELLLVNTDP